MDLNGQIITQRMINNVVTHDGLEYLFDELKICIGNSEEKSIRTVQLELLCSVGNEIKIAIERDEMLLAMSQPVFIKGNGRFPNGVYLHKIKITDFFDKKTVYRVKVFSHEENKKVYFIKEHNEFESVLIVTEKIDEGESV